MVLSKLCRLILPLAVLTACSQSDYNEVAYINETQSVIVSLSEMFDGDVQTRVDIGFVSNSPSFTFTDSDTLGIFPNVGDQVSFPLGNTGSSSATFDGGGWGLKNGCVYYAYMPFNRANFASYEQKNKLPISYIGEIQDNVNNTNNIGEYVFMTTEGTTQSSGRLKFNMRHIGALARIGITFPEVATYTKIYILAENDVFSTTGTLDLETNSISITPKTRSDRMELSLKNVKITSSSLSTSYNFYLMFPPCDCSGQTLKIVLVDSFGNTYTANTRTDKTNVFQAGAYYGFTPSTSFVKETGSSDGGGNIGFLVESDNMTNEDVNINF